MLFALFKHEGGPRSATRSRGEPNRRAAQVIEATALLEERFSDARQDGPSAYAASLASRDDEQQKARLRQDAVAIVREFMRAFREGR